MAEEISKPLTEARKVTMVSSGGSEVGAAKLAGEVLEIMTRLPSAVEKLTGIDISQVSWSYECERQIMYETERLVQVVISCFFYLIDFTGFSHPGALRREGELK